LPSVISVWPVDVADVEVDVAAVGVLTTGDRSAGGDVTRAAFLAEADQFGAALDDD